jgi:hypothetical protein
VKDTEKLTQLLIFTEAEKVSRLMVRNLEAPKHAWRSVTYASFHVVNQVWRPVRESNPCRRHKREENNRNSMKRRGMDSTLPCLKDSQERLLDS